MKKLLAVLFTALCISFAAFSQEEPVVSSGSALPSWLSGVKAGGHANIQIPLPELSNYTSFGMGAGADAEVGIPLPFLQNFALSVRGDFNANFMSNPKVNMMLNLQFAAGVLADIPVSTSGLSIVPQAEVGVAVNFLNPSSEVEELINGCYVDQLYRFGLGLRYSNEAIAGGKLQFDVTPSYVLCPEQTGLVQYVTVRIGVLYKVL